MHTVGPYRIVNEVARGGHGVVYRAQDAQGQTVALKLLLAHRAQSARARQRFQAEVNALARLRHPHVVSLLAAGEHEGCPWLALDYVEGESLEAHLRRGPLAIHAAIRVAQQLAQALSYVHGCGVLHRDLKPDNVLLRGTDALLTDFGLVLDDQRDASRLTATGVFQGTPGYWAPEQARGETREHGPATDVYGLGAVLHACLTGHPPVVAGSLQEYLQTVRFTAVPSPRTLRPEVPAWLDALCARCLAFDPAKRPGSADEVARALAMGGASPSPEDAPPGRRRAVGRVAVVGALALAALGGWALLAGDADEPEPSPANPDPSVPGAAPPGEASPAAELTPSQREAQASSESGHAHFRAGRYEEAIAAYDRALELDPGDASSYDNRGASKLSLSRHEEALADFDRALELDPTSARATLGRGLCQARLGRHEEAIEAFSRALELDPRSSAAWASRGSSKAKLNRHAEAIEDFSRALELDPTSVSGWVNRGVSKAKLGRNLEATADYDRALELDPRSATASYNRGEIKARRGSYGEAIEDFDRALEFNPRYVVVWYSRGACKARLDRHEEAIEDFDRLLELDPASVSGWHNRATSKAKLGLDEEALEDYDRALELDPRNATVCFNRGVSKLSLERYEEAIEDFDRALQLGLPPTSRAPVRQLRAEAEAKLRGE